MTIKKPESFTFETNPDAEVSAAELESRLGDFFETVDTALGMVDTINDEFTQNGMLYATCRAAFNLPRGCEMSVSDIGGDGLTSAVYSEQFDRFARCKNDDPIVHDTSNPLKLEGIVFKSLPYHSQLALCSGFGDICRRALIDVGSRQKSDEPVPEPTPESMYEVFGSFADYMKQLKLMESIFPGNRRDSMWVDVNLDFVVPDGYVADCYVKPCPSLWDDDEKQSQLSVWDAMEGWPCVSELGLQQLVPTYTAKFIYANALIGYGQDRKAQFRLSTGSGFDSTVTMPAELIDDIRVNFRKL
ncbi:hypothetical protein HGB25_02775 [Candidatus Saccharibacteria bacterium]|nr:hypothetical protein [Candidatus Saccharibacteria bacterium]